MKALRNSRSSTAIKMVIGSLALLAFLAFAQPQAAQAAGTSGGATIYNTVKVTYQSGTTVLFATANVSVTVNTVAAIPDVINPLGQTVVAGGTATYDYILKSNSNGPDTYTPSALVNTPDANIGAATATSVTLSVALWGGIALDSPAADQITVPFGTTTGLVAGAPGTGSTVQIGASTYTVTAISAGTAASTNGSGDLVAEAPATLTLTLISGTAITTGSVTAGTQVGEYKSAALTALLTAAAPTVTAVDGHYTTHYTITTGALPALTFTTPDVTTTVSSPEVTISKTANPLTASPGGTITYTITVKNTHTTATVNNVTVIDPVPAYTTYVANSTTLNAALVADVGGGSPLKSPGLLVGNLPAGVTAIIIFQVKVD